MSYSMCNAVFVFVVNCAVYGNFHIACNFNCTDRNPDTTTFNHFWRVPRKKGTKGNKTNFLTRRTNNLLLQ